MHIFGIALLVVATIVSIGSALTPEEIERLTLDAGCDISTETYDNSDDIPDKWCNGKDVMFLVGMHRGFCKCKEGYVRNDYADCIPIQECNN